MQYADPDDQERNADDVKHSVGFQVNEVHRKKCNLSVSEYARSNFEFLSESLLRVNINPEDVNFFLINRLEKTFYRGSWIGG